MELRNTRQRQRREEYCELQSTLSNYGLYEEGMKLREMKEFIKAIRESETETSFRQSDIDQALRESELDFVHMKEDVHHSTLLSTPTKQNTANPVMKYSAYQHNGDASLLSSPEMPSEKLEIVAQVHHPLNWSPQLITPLASAKADELQCRRNCFQLLEAAQNIAETSLNNIGRVQELSAGDSGVDLTHFNISSSNNSSASNCGVSENDNQSGEWP